MKSAPSSAATNAPTRGSRRSVDRQRGADQHRRDRRGQRPRPRGHQPDAQRSRDALTAAAGTSRSRACASPCRPRGPPAPPRCRRRGGWRRGRAAGCRRSRPRAALKLAFSRRSAKGESASISRHQRDRLLLEPVERHDRVDEAHLERLLRRRTGGTGTRSPCAFLVPDQVARAATRRSRRRSEPTRGPVWPKRALSAAIVRSQHEVQDVAAADRVAGDHRHHRLRQAADLDVQVGDVEAADAAAAARST